ncbi:MAG: hypothetical protein ACKO6N_20135 [Myxococcota bacterium]
MNDEGVSLLKALQEARLSSGKRHYPKALRARVVAWYRQRRAQGKLCREIGEELGIHPLQLARWARLEPSPHFRQFELIIPSESEELPDENSRRSCTSSAFSSTVSPAAGGTSDATSAPVRLTLVSPAGWRVEGLGLEQLGHIVALLP